LLPSCATGVVLFLRFAELFIFCGHKATDKTLTACLAGVLLAARTSVPCPRIAGPDGLLDAHPLFHNQSTLVGIQRGSDDILHAVHTTHQDPVSRVRSRRCIRMSHHIRALAHTCTCVRGGGDSCMCTLTHTQKYVSVCIAHTGMFDWSMRF
jgi:hypothetical protein